MPPKKEEKNLINSIPKTTQTPIISTDIMHNNTQIATHLSSSTSPVSPHPNLITHHSIQTHDSTKLFLPQALPNTPPNPPLKLLRILPPQPGSLHIRRALVVWRRQHRNYRQQNGFGRLHRRPALGGGLVAIFVFFGGVQDRDADFAGWVDWVC